MSRSKTKSHLMFSSFHGWRPYSSIVFHYWSWFLLSFFLRITETHDVKGKAYQHLLLQTCIKLFNVGLRQAILCVKSLMTIACLLNFLHYGKRTGWFPRLTRFPRLTGNGYVTISWLCVWVCGCMYVKWMTFSAMNSPAVFWSMNKCVFGIYRWPSNKICNMQKTLHVKILRGPISGNTHFSLQILTGINVNTFSHWNCIVWHIGW